MELVLRKWGNSLGVRIPTSETTRLGWHEGRVLIVEELPKGLKIETADDSAGWMEEYADRQNNNPFWGSTAADVEGESW